MSSVINVLGISGSLRRGSLNTAALQAAIELAPADMHIDIAQIGDLPLYDDDVRTAGYPASVLRLREQVRAADALLFAAPEYNYSIPGVLKNAIDWVSRPPEQPFAGKPAAIMGVSPGAIGTARAQYHLRQIGVFLDLRFLNKPEVMIGNSGDRFDAEGRLTDTATREHVQKLLLALRDAALAARG
jgi:chromate reductase